MEERRKIIIPTGVDPEETLSRRYFDTEATLAARPVVPLSDAAQAPASAVKPARARRWLLPAAIAAAVAVGVAAGLAIGVYRYRQQPQAESPVAVRPLADKTRSTLPWTYTPEEPVAEEDATTDVADGNEVTTPAPQETQPRKSDSDEADKKRAREEAARDERADRQDQIAQQREERASDERAQRQEERRRRRGKDEKNANDELPQDPIIRHTRDGVHRIREIFEGTP